MSNDKKRPLPECSCGHVMVIFRIQSEGNSLHLVIRVGADTEKEAIALFKKHVANPDDWSRCVKIEQAMVKEQASHKLRRDFGGGPSMFS